MECAALESLISLAGHQDDAELRRLLRENPVPGPVSLSYEREPTFFIDASEDTLVARAAGRIVALGSRSTYRAWVKGEVRRIGYLSQLRLDRSHRGRAHILLRGYERLRELHEERRDVEFYVTTLVDGNVAAERLLLSGHPRLPRYRRVEAFRTLVLKVRAIAPVKAEHGQFERRPTGWQFAPAWDECPADETLVSRGGSLALWDQSAFKQVVVRGYSAALRCLRPLLKLPRVGERLRMAYLSHMAVDEGSVLVNLIRAAAGRARDRCIDYLVLGLSARSHLLEAVRRAFSPREYGSTIYVVHWEDTVPELDSRPCHLEVATL